MDTKAAISLAALAILTGCRTDPAEALRKQIASTTTGIITLPSGLFEISRPLELAPSAHDLEIIGQGTLIKASPMFEGEALLVIKRVNQIRVRDISFDGERPSFKETLEMVPPENALRVWYKKNGILVDEVNGLELVNLKFARIVNFAVLVSRSSRVRINSITVDDSGSKNGLGRNNLSGGVLLEEATREFEVTNSTFSRILGNGLWTHSLLTSARLEDGVFFGNRFIEIGRDALQVGHATRVRVENNQGEKIGYPLDAVDVENGGTPVAIDTAGNVDQTQYIGNKFDEVNGKCIDLDGFHDGLVKENRCLNRLRPEDYVFGHFGIVMNNTNPDVQVKNIEMSGNDINGAKYGGLFLMGSGHRITGNRFTHLNTAKCPEAKSKFACIYNRKEPQMLTSGIYLGLGVARTEEVTGNLIENNYILGHGMKANCVVAGPGVALAKNQVKKNDCSDEIEQEEQASGSKTKELRR